MRHDPKQDSFAARNNGNRRRYSNDLLHALQRQRFLPGHLEGNQDQAVGTFGRGLARQRRKLSERPARHGV